MIHEDRIGRYCFTGWLTTSLFLAQPINDLHNPRNFASTDLGREGWKCVCVCVETLPSPEPNRCRRATDTSSSPCRWSQSRYKVLTVLLHGCGITPHRRSGGARRLYARLRKDQPWSPSTCAPSRMMAEDANSHPPTLELSVEGCKADTQQGRSQCLVAPGMLQHPSDVLAFNVFQIMDCAVDVTLGQVL